MPVITFIASYPEMVNLAKEVFEAQKKQDIALESTEEFELEILTAASTEAVLRANITSSVVVARGAIIYDLKKMGYPIPVVELYVAGTDLVVSLTEAKRSFGELPTAVIGSTNMIAGIEQISDSVGLPIQSYLLTENSIHEVIRNVEQAHKDGMKTIVGGSNGCRHAKTLGLNSVLIRSGKESIWQAISEAKRIASISIKEQYKASMYKTILNYSFEGIIAVDHSKTVLVFNEIGQRILGIPDTGESYTNKHVDSVIKNNEIAALIKGDRDFVEETVRYQNNILTFNNVPVIMDGHRVGRVFSFQNVNRLQELEGKIRGKIYSKGHRAKYSISDILGTSAEIEKAKKTCYQYAVVDSSVLILGETGTGKELFAQSIHMLSNRANQPFVAVNCAALSESLLESELFGYVEGAFTGAVKKGKKGLFELAHNGTIFLDEVSEIPLSLQGKLLRVIQEREVMPLGHDRVIPINVRIIAATNKELRNLIKQGEFREDLYFRLNVLTLRIPPLRQRKEDFLLLIEKFLLELSSVYGHKAPSLDSEAVEKLAAYDWPGNIRELRNMCEKLSVLSKSEIITAEDVTEYLRDQFIHQQESSIAGERKDVQSFFNHVEQERFLIKKALEETQFNKTKAAQLLGMSRVTLWRKMQEYSM